LNKKYLNNVFNICKSLKPTKQKPQTKHGNRDRDTGSWIHLGSTSSVCLRSLINAISTIIDRRPDTTDHSFAAADVRYLTRWRIQAGVNSNTNGGFRWGRAGPSTFRATDWRRHSRSC